MTSTPTGIVPSRSVRSPSRYVTWSPNRARFAAASSRMGSETSDHTPCASGNRSRKTPMSRRLATPALPPELREFLDGQRLAAKTNDVIELLTVGEEGWPHVALLSVGEVLAASDTEVRLALWPDSQTTANVRRTSRAT